MSAFTTSNHPDFIHIMDLEPSDMIPYTSFGKMVRVESETAPGFYAIDFRIGNVFITLYSKRGDRLAGFDQIVERGKENESKHSD